MTTVGTVRVWHSDEGWGVIDSDDTPGGCWAHFSSVLVGGYRSLDAGQQVTVEFTPARQDGYDFRAVAVWHGDIRPEPPAQEVRSIAYRSTLHIEFDAPADVTGPDRTG